VLHCQDAAQRGGGVELKENQRQAGRETRRSKVKSEVSLEKESSRFDPRWRCLKGNQKENAGVKEVSIRKDVLRSARHLRDYEMSEKLIPQKRNGRTRRGAGWEGSTK